MKKYQKIITGLVALSSIALAKEGTIIDKFAIYKVEDFSHLRAMPTFSLGAPVGLAGAKGGAFLGFSGITDQDGTDGGMSLGIGYGDPNKIGGTLSLSIGSIDPRDGGAFNRGSLNVSAGHNFPDMLAGIALGIDNVNLWHASEVDYDENPSIYLAATKLFPNDIAPMTFSVGAGNNNFAKVNESSNKKDKIYPFISGAVYVLPQVSVILDYTADITSVGVGLVPFPDMPISLTFEAYDITKERKEDKVSFLGSVSIGYYL